MLQNPFAVRPSYTTLYDPPTTACNTFTTPLRRSTTRSQSHHNALRPFYSFVTTSYNPSTTLYNAFTIPSTVSFTTSYNPSTTLYDPSTASLQRHATLYSPPTVFVTTSYNPSTTLYNPSSNVIQPSYNALR